MAEYVWRADAEYADGSEVHEVFQPNPNLSEDEDQYRIENWLINDEKECVWYSVGIEYVD